MYYNWFILESFLNRFSMHIKWLYALYLGAFIGVIGVAVNVEGCGLSSFTLGDVPYPCFDFALFISIGRFFVFTAWLIASIGTTVAREYCIWRALSAFLPLVFYFTAMFMQANWLVFPILWFIGIGLDIIMHVVPSTIVWPWAYIPRHTHFAEERHAMMYIVALGECVIAAGIPVRVDVPFGRTVQERYLAMFGIVFLSFALCIQNFIASDTAKLEHNGGTHGLHASRIGRIVWLFTQFGAVTFMVIAGAICKYISKKLELTPFFRYWFGFSIAAIVLLTAISQVVHVYPPGDTRTCSRPVRFIVRAACACVVAGLTCIPVSLLNEPGWILIVAGVVLGFTIIEWFGRNKTGVRGHGHGHGHGGHGHGHGGHGGHGETDEHEVPLLGHVLHEEEKGHGHHGGGHH